MYDNLEEAITHKRFVPTPRPYPSAKLQETYNVEPWEKNTIENQIKQDVLSRQAKTFYYVPPAKTQEKYYATHRGFGLKKQSQSRALTKPKSLAAVSRKSAISQYNISGNILGEALSQIPQVLPFQLPAKRIRSLKLKQKSVRKGLEATDHLPICQSILAIKRRISIKRKQSDIGFVHLNSENDEEHQKIQAAKKKSKVISLGYHKLKMFGKQNSVQLSVGGSMFV